MAVLQFFFVISILSATTIAERNITVLNLCSGAQYLHYVFQDAANTSVQSGSVPIEKGDTYKPNFVETFWGYIWMNNENCNPFNSATGCYGSYGTMAQLQLSFETSTTANSYIVPMEAYQGVFTNSFLIQSWPDTTACPEVYAYQLEDATVIGANTPVDCPNGHSYRVIMCASERH